MRGACDREAAITGNRQEAWEPAEGHVVEDDVLRRARERARQAGVGAIPPGGGAALRMLAAAVDARAIAEIGTGAGVSGLYLLRGMRADGVLTTVDPEPSAQALAREAFKADGWASGQYRLIAGGARQVLPRLADGGYDLVFCDGDQAEWPEYLEEALRLLRAGGLMVFAGLTRAASDGDGSAALRRTAVGEALRTVRESERLVAAVLPLADGLLCAVKR